MRGATVALLVGLAALASARAQAQGMDLTSVGARGIARAGAIVVSADDGAALWVNPAGIARRSRLRAQLGVFLSDRGARYASAQAYQSDPVPESDRQGGEVGFWAGAQAALGERVVVGAAYLEPTRLSLATARPAYERPDPADDFRYPGRYGGTRLSYRRRAVALGASVRVLPTLAAGVSGLALDAALTTDRTIFGAQEEDPDFRDPNFDLGLTVSARDRFVPGAAAGLLFAPESLPVELAASVLWVQAATLDGDPTLRDSRGVTGEDPRVAAIVGAGASASTAAPGTTTARLGARGTFGPVGVELAGELATPAGGDDDIAIAGVAIQAGTEAAADVTAIPSPLRTRRTFAARAAVDVTLASGAITLSTGWAFTQGALAARDLSPALPDLDAHTIAFGAEGHVGRATISLGLARTIGLGRDVAEADTASTVTAPRIADPPAAAAGHYSAAATLVGLGVELDLD